VPAAGRSINVIDEAYSKASNAEGLPLFNWPFAPDRRGE